MAERSHFELSSDFQRGQIRRWLAGVLPLFTSRLRAGVSGALARSFRDCSGYLFGGLCVKSTIRKQAASNNRGTLGSCRLEPGTSVAQPAFFASDTSPQARARRPVGKTRDLFVLGARIVRRSWHCNPTALASSTPRSIRRTGHLDSPVIDDFSIHEPVDSYPAHCESLTFFREAR